MDTVLRGADTLRREVWRVVARTRLGRRCARDRSWRLAVLASGHVAVALALTVLAPLWLLLLAPLVLGVPHIVSDVRFLLVRPPRSLAAGAALGLLVPLGLMTALRALSAAGGPSFPEAEPMLGMAAVALGALLAQPRGAAAVLTAAGVVALAALALARPRDVALWLGHAHNLIAVGLWVAWSKGALRRGPVALVVGLIALGIAVIASGVLEPLTAAMSGFDAPLGRFDMGALVDTLAPDLEPTLGLRLVLIYAFAQSMHYTLWLRLVPGTMAPSPAPQSFRRGVTALRADLGRVGLAVAVGLSVLVPVVAIGDPVGTRATYLALVLFHGWLELAVIAHLALLAGRRPA